MRIPVRIVALLLLLAAAPAHAQTTTMPTDRVAMIGASVARPPGGPWVEEQDDWSLFFGRQHASRFHTTIAFVSCWAHRDSSTTPEQWLEATRDRILRQEKSSRGDRLEVEFLQLEIDTTIAPLAVRYRYRFEDTKVPGMKGQAAVALTSGLHVRHPLAPLQLNLTFSERAPKGTPFEDDTTSARFLAGFQLTRPDDVLSPSVRADPNARLIARGRDVLWVATRPSQDGKLSPGELLRLDPVSLEVTGRVTIGRGPTDLALTDDAVWIAHDGEPLILRVAAATMTVAARLKPSKIAARIADAGACLWASDRAANVLWRIDPTANTMRQVPLKGGWRNPFTLLVRDGLLWVGDAENRLVVLDAMTGAMSGSSVGVGPGVRSMASGAGSVWVLCQSMKTVQRIDPSSRRVSATIPLRQHHPGMIQFHEGSLWISDVVNGSLDRLDAGTNALFGPLVRVGLSYAMFAAPDGIWISDSIGEHIGLFKPSSP